MVNIPPVIRLARSDDLPAINELFNHYVLHSTASYADVPMSMRERLDWFAEHGPAHPVVVAESGGGEIIGWGSLSRFHERAAYRWTVENSVYVRHDRRERGVGRALMVDLIARARAAGHRSIVALIDAEQSASLALHDSLGFERVGRLREAGWKFERWLDVVYAQLILVAGPKGGR